MFLISCILQHCLSFFHHFLLFIPVPQDIAIIVKSGGEQLNLVIFIMHPFSRKSIFFVIILHTNITTLITTLMNNNQYFQ